MRLLLLAFFLSLQTLSAQTFVGDSLVVYTPQEALKIALKLTQGQECDTALKLAEVQLINDSIIQHQDKLNIKSLEKISIYKDTLMDHQDQVIKSYKKKMIISHGFTLGLVIIVAFLVLR